MPAPLSTRPARACRSLAILLLAGGAWACTSPAAADETKSPCVRPNDSLWLVSHRGLGCRGDEPLEKLQCWRFEESWERASLADLLADDCPNRITTVFVHGNRIDGAEAFTTGFRAYQALVRCAGDRPVRFVIWSWPSERVCGPVKDARIKAARTAPSARYLARLIDRLDSTDRLSLWGHSFGARVVAGALDLLAGGQVGGRPLAERVHPARNSVRAVLVVAGDVDAAAVAETVRRYFGDLPSGPPSKRVKRWVAPREEATREDMFDRVAQPRVDVAYTVPGFGETDNDTLGVFDEQWPWVNAGADIQTHSIDLDLVDLDADFDIDVVMSSRNSQARIYLNNMNNGISGSAFNDITQFALIAQGATMNGNSNYESECGDLDGDGDFDVWFKNYNGFTDRILVNDGFTAGSGVKFTQHNNWIKNDSGSDENEVDFIDFDGDGDLDAMLSNFSGTNHFYVSGLAQGLNPGTTGLYHRAGATGSIYTQGELPTGNPGGLTTLDGDTVDVDNDGDQDLAMANDANQQNYLYTNVLGIPDTHAPTVHIVTNQADKANGTDTVIHAQLRDNNSYYVVNFYDVNLVYTVDGGSPVSLDMFAQGSMQFRGVIPAQTDAVVAYHIEATDLAGNSVVSADLDYVQGTPAGDPWTDVGCSLAGVSGPPLLVGSGPLTTGSAGSLALTNAAPSAACMLFVSLSSTPVGFKGGTLCAFPFVTSLPLATNGAGALTLPWASWPSGLSGASLYFQYAISDAAGPAGYAASNGLTCLTP